MLQAPLSPCIGVTAHTGYAKGVLKNAILIAMEYQSLLPAYETPGCTEGREGFYHLDRLEGCTETAKMKFLIRDHDHGKFLRRQELMEEACRYLNNKYGQGTVEIQIQESYLNMYEKVKDHKELISHVFEAMEKAQVTPHCGSYPRRNRWLPPVLHGPAPAPTFWHRGPERPWTP